MNFGDAFIKKHWGGIVYNEVKSARKRRES